MSKVMTMVGIMSGIMLLLYFGGLLGGTISGTLLNYALNPEQIENLGLLTAIASVGGIAVALGGLVATRLTGTDAYLWYPIVVVLLGFGWDFLIVYQNMAAYSEIGRVIGALIFGPLIVMYVISVLDWWRGVSA